MTGYPKVETADLNGAFGDHPKPANGDQLKTG
jgi:hypothetical protein